MGDDERHLSAVPDDGEPPTDAELEEMTGMGDYDPMRLPETPEYAAYATHLRQWLTRIYHRQLRTLRVLELGAPKIILENEARMLNDALVHLVATVYEGNADVRGRIAQLFQEETDAYLKEHPDLGDED